MGVFSDIGCIGAVAIFAGKLVDKIFPDPVAWDAAKLELLKMQQSGELAQLAADTDLAKGQLAINQVEASNENIFVSGWRPAIGWVCGTAFAYHFVLQPLLAFLMAAAGHPVTLPVFQMGELSTVLMGMLGLGGLRTIEKVKGAV